jgi:membrane-bound ClpP family serine protease
MTMDYNWLVIGGLIVVGLVLLALEVYVPGFVLGSVAVVLLVAAAWWTYRTAGVAAAGIVVVIEAGLGVAVVAGALKYFPETPLGRKMILAEDQTGVHAQTVRGLELIGREGVAQSLLRPSGVAMVDGKRLDVVAESGMIERGSAIRIVAVEENRIVVRKTTS